MSAEHEPDPLVAPRDEQVDPGDDRAGAAQAVPSAESVASGRPVPSGESGPVAESGPSGESASGESVPAAGSGPSGRSGPAAEPPSEPLATPAEGRRESRRQRRQRRTRRQSGNMLAAREHRSLPERALVRVIATCGIVGIGVVVAAIMRSSGSQGWIIGLVVAAVSVSLSAILWSSRTL